MRRMLAPRRPPLGWRVLGVAALFAVLAAGGVLAQGTRDGLQIMKLSEVRAGMKGYGLTTFRGTKVERFDVEVLGVLRGWAPQGALVLVRMRSPVLDETGTVAGMSGSPVYLEGKLLGAVAYGFWFCKVPLAGVTPVEEMLVVNDIDLADRQADRRGRKALHRRVLRERARGLLEELKRGELATPVERERALSRMVAPCRPGRRPLWPASGLPEHVRSLLPQEGALAPLPLPLAVSGTARPPGARGAHRGGLD